MRKPRITKEQIERVLELQKEGLPYADIAEKVQISAKTVSTVCIKNGIRRRVSDAESRKMLFCPKCHRGGFPRDYQYCPFCQADMRSEKDKLIAMLKQTSKLFKDLTFPNERDGKAQYALNRAIEYLEVHGDD